MKGRTDTVLIEYNLATMKIIFKFNFEKVYKSEENIFFYFEDRYDFGQAN